VPSVAKKRIAGFALFFKYTRCMLTMVSFLYILFREVSRMQAIRETRRIDRNYVTIDLPDEFLSQEVEIIVLPLYEKQTKTIPDHKSSFLKFVDSERYKLPGDYKFNREELYDR
jgi:hypothetical protein